MNRSASSDPVVIIGAGLTGVSCALGLLEARIPVILLDDREYAGGQLSEIPSKIINFAGSHYRDGKEASFRLLEALNLAAQDAKRDEIALEYRRGVKVEKILLNKDKLDEKLHNFEFEVQTANTTFPCSTLVVGTGYRENRLELIQGSEYLHYHGGLENEKNSKQSAIVIGGGDSAFLHALDIADLCSKVYVVARSEKLRARPDLVERLGKRANAEMLKGLVPESIKMTAGGQLLVTFLTKGEPSEKVHLPADRVFAKVGYKPNTEILQGLVDISPDGHIMVEPDFCLRKNGERIENFYAGGDIVSGELARMAISVGHGMSIASTIIRKRFGFEY